MPNLSIKNVPADVVVKLRDRATANHRSLQGELMALVTSAVSKVPGAMAGFESKPIRPGHKSIEQIAAEHRARVNTPIRKGVQAVDLIRAERNAR